MTLLIEGFVSGGRIGEAEGFQSGHSTKLIRDSSFRDYLDLFKFRFVEAKEFRHLNDLIRTHEIGGLSAESVNTGSKLAALHRFRDIQTKAAHTFRRVKQTEFANNHSSLPFQSRATPHRFRMDHFAIH